METPAAAPVVAPPRPLWMTPPPPLGAPLGAAVSLREQVDDKSVILSQTTLFVGALFSTFACGSVIFKYLSYKSVRRPPLSLLFWRTVADLLFALQYLVTFCVQGSIHDDTFWGKKPEFYNLCKIMSFYTQFTAFASEMWLLMICADLVLSLTQVPTLCVAPSRVHSLAR